MDDLKTNLLSLVRDVKSYLYQEELLQQKSNAQLIPSTKQTIIKSETPTIISPKILTGSQNISTEPLKQNENASSLQKTSVQNSIQSKPIIEKTSNAPDRPMQLPLKAEPSPLAKPPPEAKKTHQNKEFVFSLEKPTVPEIALHDMHALTKKIAPNLFLHEKIPSDRKAITIKNAYQKRATHATATFLYFGNTYKSFIKNVVHATDIALCDASLVEKPFQNSNEWEVFLQSSHIKLIIAADSVFFDDKTLRKFYTENAAEKSCFLCNIPLLLLPDLSLYYKDPYLKRSLWNLICQSLPQKSK